jgi:hypothetical protein
MYSLALGNKADEDIQAIETMEVGQRETTPKCVKE